MVWLAIKVAFGPGGLIRAEVVEDGVEVGEIDVAVDVRIAEQFGSDENGAGVGRHAAKGGERGGEGGVVDDGETEVGGEGEETLS